MANLTLELDNKDFVLSADEVAHLDGVVQDVFYKKSRQIICLGPNSKTNRKYKTPGVVFVSGKKTYQVNKAKRLDQLRVACQRVMAGEDQTFALGVRFEVLKCFVVGSPDDPNVENRIAKYREYAEFVREYGQDNYVEANMRDILVSLSPEDRVRALQQL